MFLVVIFFHGVLPHPMYKYPEPGGENLAQMTHVRSGTTDEHVGFLFNTRGVCVCVG